MEWTEWGSTFSCCLLGCWGFVAILEGEDRMHSTDMPIRARRSADVTDRDV
jgi:hypothetical protein